MRLGLANAGALALRHALLTLGRSETVRNLALRVPAARAFARRFVAGETREDALHAVQRLDRQGIAAAVDFLGENVTARAQAEDVAREYRQLIDDLGRAAAEAYVSIKLTAFGLDVDDDLCRDLVESVAEHAAERGAFVRIDMEGSAYTERTLELFRRLHAGRPNIGIVLQAYLRRTARDLEEMISLGARVRLCKGAYDEPVAIAFASRAEVDESYRRLMERLLDSGKHPALATHDPRLISHALTFARSRGITRDRFEIQMLYGIGRDLQTRLVRDGYRVRVYVPYGTHWYGYFVRRLAERPANLMFFFGAALRR